MVLVRIIAIVREDEVRISSRFQCFKPAFDLLPLLGKISVTKSKNFHLYVGATGEKLSGGCARFSLAFSAAAQNAPA